MPQHAAELDRRATPQATARAERRIAPAQQAADPAAETVQRALDDSPRVAALERMGDALAQRRTAESPVVQRRVGPDEGRPGMEVRVIRNGRVGFIRGRVRSRSTGEHVGWVVQTQVRVDNDMGTQHYLFDEVDPLDAPVARASAAPVTAPSQPSPPPSLSLSSSLVPSSGLGLGGPPPSAMALGMGPLSVLGSGSPLLTGGSVSSNPNLFAASQGGGPPPPTVSASPSTVSVASGSPSTSAPQADNVVREGDGVQFTVDNRFWHDGYVTLIDDGTYHVYVDGKLIRDHLGYSTVQVSARQVRTSPAIKARMGAKRTKSSKREYRADRLASPEQVREVQGQYAAVSPLLLRHPVLFGPVLRSGGHTGTEAVSAIGKDRGIAVTMPQGTRGKSRGRELGNAIVATDTNAMLATRLDDATTGPGQWVLHGKAANNEAADHPTLNEAQLGALKSVNLAEFRRQYVFSQGSTRGEAITLPSGDRRTQLHAEAKAVRSRTWQHIIDQTVAEFTPASSSSSAASAEPARETRRKVISIVINRSSCGSAKSSGFGGGCAQELATVIAAFWTTLGERLGAERAARLRRDGLIRIEVSAAGQYEYEGQVDRTATAGARLALHPNYDFDRDMPEPLNLSRYQYMRRLAQINSGQASGSGSSGDSGGEEDSELARLLALIAQMRAPVRRPLSRVALGVGQHQVTGMFNRGHSGRIACTSIAACALEQMLNSPGEQVDQAMLMTLIAAGTDIDADLRRGLGGGGGGSNSSSSARTGSGMASAPKRQATSSRDDDSGIPSSLSALIASLVSGLSSPQQAPPSVVERPLPSMSLLMLPSPPREPSNGSMTGSSPMSLALPTTRPASQSPSQPPPQIGLQIGLQPGAPTSKRSSPEPALATSSGSSGSKKKVRSDSAEERYFAHDEVQAQFPGMRVDQAAIDAAGPQYLYGVRGDYRRIARQLARGGPRRGLLVTIGGATIMVANLSTLAQRRFALFDSHNQAVYEIYDTEQGLAEGIEDLYPALPGVDEMDAAWYATPYRPT